MGGIVLEFDRSPALSDAERLQSFMESVQRAFNEFEVTYDDMGLEKHPLIATLSNDNRDFRVMFKDYGEFKVITANAIQATIADFQEVYAELFAADEAIVGDLRAEYVEADLAVIDQISGEIAEYEQVIAGQLEAISGKFDTIETDYIKGVDADFKYVAINKANIDEAWIEDLLVQGKFLATDVNAETGSFSKYLTGVKIYGDHIVGGTVSTERLIIRDPDNNTGILYEINNGIVEQEDLDEDELKRLTLDGKVITAESITADKINVTDLFAQDITATGTIRGVNLIGVNVETKEGKIAGFTIKANSLEGGDIFLYSEKESGGYMVIEAGKEYGNLQTRYVGTGVLFFDADLGRSFGDFRLQRSAGLATYTSLDLRSIDNDGEVHQVELNPYTGMLMLAGQMSPRVMMDDYSVLYLRRSEGPEDPVGDYFIVGTQTIPCMLVGSEEHITYNGLKLVSSLELSLLENKVNNYANMMADKNYVVSVFEELKELIKANNAAGAVAILDKAILDLSVLA